MKVSIVDYGSGNLHSAAKAFERANRENALGFDVIVTDKADEVANSDYIVLPGVGAFADCRRGLDAVDGMIAALQEVVIEKGRPFLGICVGTQLMATRGLEKTSTAGLDWISGDVSLIEPNLHELKVPQMGWNTIEVVREHHILTGIQTGNDGLHAYFVHSYHFLPTDPHHVISQCEYGGKVNAIIGRDNIIGTQFHPEKSQKLGLALIGNFLQWKP